MAVLDLGHVQRLRQPSWSLSSGGAWRPGGKQSGGLGPVSSVRFAPLVRFGFQARLLPPDAMT